MKEKQAAELVSVEITGTVIRRGIQLAPGTVHEFRPDQAKRLIDRGHAKPAKREG